MVFIHGLGTIASDYEDVRHYFLTHGYCDSEFYATSYGKGALTLATDAVFCQYVKSQRLLIAAVAAYTNNEVDIIGFSMGSPMGRKAILGGNCVDTGEDLGDPLTNYVHTFIGVAGANFGAAYLCHVVVPAPLFHVCNSNNGISCHSDLLNELNSQGYTYEGRLVYTLYSEDDEVVGYKVCGGTVLATAIPGETKAFGFGPVSVESGETRLVIITIEHAFFIVTPAGSLWSDAPHSGFTGQSDHCRPGSVTFHRTLHQSSS